MGIFKFFRDLSTVLGLMFSDSIFDESNQDHENVEPNESAKAVKSGKSVTNTDWDKN